MEKQAKDCYFFSHDYNARNDRKIAALVRDYRAAGYGIFWATCELMHEEGGSMEFDDLTIGAIADDLKEHFDFVKEIIEQCINKYKLFQLSGSRINSLRVAKNLQHKQKTKQTKAEAGRLGGLNSGESRRKEKETKQNTKQRSTASSNEANEIKGNEIKEDIKKEIVVKKKTVDDDGMTHDFESYLLEHRKEFEAACMSANKSETIGLQVLERFHQWHVSKEIYPKSTVQLLSSFKTWLMKERNSPPIVEMTPYQKKIQESRQQAQSRW